jgi:hypothetical protein
MTDTGAEPEAWNYLAVVVPIAVFSGPFGSLISSYLHRQVLAWFIYVLDTLALVIHSSISILLRCPVIS